MDVLILSQGQPVLPETVVSHTIYLYALHDLHGPCTLLVSIRS